MAIRLAVCVAFALCTYRALTFASLSVANRFRGYDDEGYVLISLREFLAGGALFNEVYTQYGPSYYAFKHLLSFVQGLPTHDLTRLTTVYTWVGAAILLGLAGFWLTRSGLAAVATFCVAWFAMLPIGNEPGHPQEFLVALTALSIAVAASPMKLSRRMMLLAGISALACFTKINVGTFIALATVMAIVPLRTVPVRLVAAGLLGLMPAAIMAPNLASYAAPYAAATGAGLVAAIVLRPNPQWSPSSFRQAWPILAAFVVPVVLLTIYVVVRGTTIDALLDGIVFRPARSHSLFVLPLAVPRSAALVSLAAAAGATYLFLVSAVRERLVRYLPLVQIAVGLYVIGPAPLWNRPQAIGASGAIVTLLLLGSSRSTGDSFGRSFLALSAAFHTLTAYPTAGSQTAWSACLLLVASGICVWDGLGALRLPLAVPAWGRAVATACAALALVVHYYTLTPVAMLHAAAKDRMPLPFEGARSIRMGLAEVATLNWVAQNVKAHCTHFVTLPGLNSLYAWTGMRPPNGYNSGAWMILMSDAEQRATVARLAASPRPCAVSNPGGFMWTATSLKGQPLYDYIMALTPVATAGGCELRTTEALAATWGLTYLQTGTRTYTGTDIYPVPVQSADAPTIRFWFRSTARGGTLVGVQSTSTPPEPPMQWCPTIYIGRDGRLRAGLSAGTMAPITTADRVDDGQWHHLVFVRKPERQQLYVDGVLAGEVPAPPPPHWISFMQLGNGFTARWPESNGGWFPFQGEMRDVAVAASGWEPEDVSRDFMSSGREHQPHPGRAMTASAAGSARN